VDDTIYSTTTTSDSSSDESDKSDDCELVISNPTVVDSTETEYYRNAFLSIENNADNQTDYAKSVTIKKKNISQMGRKKANRALNGKLI